MFTAQLTVYLTISCPIKVLDMTWAAATVRAVTAHGDSSRRQRATILAREG